MLKMAGSTRLELATSGVTGRRSNQLNYDPAWVSYNSACASGQRAKICGTSHGQRLVGGTGFEPVTAGV